MIFKEPLLISSSSVFDFIEVKVQKEIFFISEKGEVLEEQELLEAELPPQISLAAAESVEAVGKVFNAMFTGSTGIVTNMVLAGAL